MTDTPASGADFNRAFAEHALVQVRGHQRFGAEQVASMAKWLTASLLAVNGAGAIAVFNRTHSVDHPTSAGVLFTLGIGFALLSGTALQELYNRVSTPLHELDSYWTGVSITGVRDETQEKSLNGLLDAINRFAFIPPLLGWFSGFLFLAGAILLAI